MTLSPGAQVVRVHGCTSAAGVTSFLLAPQHPGLAACPTYSLGWCVSVAFEVVQVQTAAISLQFSFFFWEGTKKPEMVWQLYTLHFRKTSPSNSCHLTKAGTSWQLYQPSPTSTKVGGFADPLSLDTTDFPAMLALTDQTTSLSYWWLLWAPQKGRAAASLAVGRSCSPTHPASYPIAQHTVGAVCWPGSRCVYQRSWKQWVEQTAKWLHLPQQDSHLY